MTKAIVSDYSGKTISDKLAYKVSIYSYGQKTHLDLDCEVDPLKEMLAMAIQNGCAWYQLTKGSDGKWSRTAPSSGGIS